MNMKYILITFYILVNNNVAWMQGMEMQLTDSHQPFKRAFIEELNVGTTDEEIELHLICDECSVQFQTERGLAIHRGMKHKMAHGFPYIELVSPLENDLICSKRSSASFDCDICNHQFKTYASLNSHKISKHNSSRAWKFHRLALGTLNHDPKNIALDKTIYAAQIGLSGSMPLMLSSGDEQDVRKQLEDSHLNMNYNPPTSEWAMAAAVEMRRGSQLPSPLALSSPSEGDLGKLLESPVTSDPMVKEKFPKQMTFDVSLLEQSIKELGLQKVIYTHLKHAGIKKIGDLVVLSERDVKNIMYIGVKSFKEIKETIIRHGLSFSMKIPVGSL